MPKWMRIRTLGDDEVTGVICDMLRSITNRPFSIEEIVEYLSEYKVEAKQHEVQEILNKLISQNRVRYDIYHNGIFYTYLEPESS